MFFPCIPLQGFGIVPSRTNLTRHVDVGQSSFQSSKSHHRGASLTTHGIETERRYSIAASHRWSAQECPHVVKDPGIGRQLLGVRQ